MSSSQESSRAALPQVDALLRSVPELTEVGHDVARWIVRRELTATRSRLRAGAPAAADHAGGGTGAEDVREAVAAAARGLLARRVRRVINATGVVLHTNLGRAPLTDAARDAILDAMGAATVEYDVTSGARGARAPVAATLAAALSDAEDALVVNNNAAALLLALAALAFDREVIVGRGELIEIGGEFRLPEIMAASGAHLREVGTTNRTRATDYASAVNERTALILKVHPSNFRIVGFTESPDVRELTGLGVPVMYDVGSGLLRATPGFDEPDAASALADGAAIVCFSGDKLLGGPQAGVIAGRADLVERCRRHPIARAVRADKLTLAAMEATLWAHARGEQTEPMRMLRADVEELRTRAKDIVTAARIGELVDGTSVPGGGSMPGASLPSVLVSLPSAEYATRLRSFDPPVIARVESGATLLDVRTVDPRDDEILIEALRTLG